MAHIGFPPGVLSMFDARPPLPFKKPMPSGSKKLRNAYTGLSDFVQYFEEPQVAPKVQVRPPETRRQKLERISRERKEKAEAEIKKQLEKWSPMEDPKIQGDPYKTMFVARLVRKRRNNNSKKTNQRFESS